MLISSIDTDIQRKGIYLGRRMAMVRFALSNIDSPYKDIPQTGIEYGPEEFFLALKDEQKKKPEMICLTGGEPLLQIEYLKVVLEELPLPLYLETNGTLPEALAEVKDYASMVCVQLVPDFINEFTKSLEVLNKSDFYVRLILDKEYGPKQIEDYAKIIASVNEKAILVLEPLFGIKNYLALQAMALRQLKDVRVIPRMHL